MKTVLAVLTLLFGTRSFAQSDDAAIKQTINSLFDGMRRSDTAMIRSAFAPQGSLQTVLKNRDGKVIIRSEPLDSFIAFIGKPHKEVYDERITFETLKVDGDLAIAWTPYRFYVNEKFSHCGVDSFQLVKLNGEWKIYYLIDTRRKQDCD
jgi:hypothetical protein